MTTCRKCRRPIRLELADDGPEWLATVADTGACRHYPDHAELADVAEFEHPFRITPAGAVADDIRSADLYRVGVTVPEVWHVDGPADVEIHGDGWEALTGYTGQHAYNGAVMHSSEYMGGRLADDILSAPGVYVCTVVNVHPEEMPECTCPRAETLTVHDDGCPVPGWEPDDDPEPAGWAVLRLELVPCIAGCGEPAEPGMSTCTACGAVPGASTESADN